MKGSFTTRKGALYCIVMTCLCSLLATGCASKYGAQTTDVHYYPDCYQPIADLRRAEKSRRGLPAGIRRGEHQNAREKRAAL